MIYALLSSSLDSLFFLLPTSKPSYIQHWLSKFLQHHSSNCIVLNILSLFTVTQNHLQLINCTFVSTWMFSLKICKFHIHFPSLCDRISIVVLFSLSDNSHNNGNVTISGYDPSYLFFQNKIVLPIQTLHETPFLNNHCVYILLPTNRFEVSLP